MSSFIRTLFAAEYAPTPLSIATAVAALAILVFGIAVMVRARRWRTARAFFVLTLTNFGWLGPFALMSASSAPEHAIAWARLGHFWASLVPAAVFHFAAEYVGRRRYRRWAAVAWTICGGIALLTLVSDALIASVRRYPWGFYPIGRPYGGAIIITFSTILIAAMFLFWRSYRENEGAARERAAMLLLAFVLGSFGMLDYLPSVGIALPPVGFMACVGFVVVAATAIWRFELADITPEYAATQILETMKGAVLVVDMHGAIRVVNRAACQLLGYTVEELTNQHIRRILMPEQNLTTGQLLNSMGVLEHSMVWQHADGTRVDVLASSSFLRNTDGVPVGVVYVASDYTERKKAEQALRDSERRYRTLFDGNPLPMWLYDAESLCFVAVNDAAVAHYGWSREEFLRMTIEDIRPPDEVERLRALLRRGIGPDAPRQWRHRKKDGTVIDVEIRSFDLLSGGKRTRLVIAQDVTDQKKAEQELRASEERYRELFENANDLVFTHDLEGRITSVNLAAERISGYTRDELLGTPIHRLVAPEHVERAHEALARKLRGEAAATAYDLDIIARNGRRIALELSTRLIHADDGTPIGVQGIARDVTERRASEERFRHLFERNLAGVYRTGSDGAILDCNDACARIFGYESREELIGRNAASFYFDATDRERVLQILEEHGSLTNQELQLRRRDGSRVWVLENVSRIDDVLEGTLIDITDRKYAQEQIEYQAYHDVLTGLPNRLLFRDRIGIALAHARRVNRTVAVMFLDLDQFKHVNDTLGHTVGDRLLQAIGARLVNCVRAEDTVARMGGDEFTILLPDLADRRNAATVALKVLDAVRHPVTVDDHELLMTTSIGISVFPDDGDDAEMLLKNADRAMYYAKELGRDTYQYATPHEGEGRLLLERRMQQALEHDEFVIHYQPMVEVATGRVVGAEALVRWNHPERGLISPEEFIPVAEETQLIVPLGEWVLRTACRQMKAWHDAGHARLRVAVNLSPRQFQHRDLVGTIARILAETGFPAEYLDLEITESTAMQNADLALAVLARLKEMGLRISIDDFGTGYSSLSYLKRLPVDTVKIDQYFVRDVTAADNQSAIISAVISMARALNLRVIAEGVETEAQLDFLRREQCSEIQGFLYSEPLPAAEFERALRATGGVNTTRRLHPHV